MPSESALHPDVITAERLGDEIAELSARIEVATARLLDKVREFDALGGWGHAGAKSCAEWLSWRVGLDLRAAYERVRVARALPKLPLISAAFARAEVSYSKVRALTRVATPQTEERLLTVARNGTATHVEKVTRAWRRVDRNAENREAHQQHRSRTLSVYQDEDGMFVIRGRLSPEVGAVVRQAITAATDRLYTEGRRRTPGEDTPTTGQVQADALGIIAEAALDHDLDPGSSGARYQVVVHVDAAPNAGNGAAVVPGRREYGPLAPAQPGESPEQRADRQCPQANYAGPGQDWIAPRVQRACRIIVLDNGRSVREAFLHNVPRAMFLFLPLLAAGMMLMYWWPRHYYVEHLLLFVHNHAFGFLLLLLAAGVSALLPWAASWVRLAVCLYIPWYVYRSMRLVYGQGRWLTLTKLVVLGFFYLASGSLMLGLAVAYSAFTL